MLTNLMKSMKLVKLAEMIKERKFLFLFRKFRVMGIKEAFRRFHGILKIGSYPFSIPSVEIERNLDFLVLQFPARYQPMMPNGLGYLYNILNNSKIHFQIIDLNVIYYHRYHSRRILEGIPTTSSGYIFKEDPWDNTNTDEWDKEEVIGYFWHEIENLVQKITLGRPKIIGLSIHANNRTLSNRVIKALRAQMPEVIIIVGGYDCFYHEVGPNLVQDFDYMIIGEAELSLNPLIGALLRGERPRDLKGIISRYDSPGREWMPTPLFDAIDSIGFPKYEWMDLSLFHTYEGDHLVPITASRGCHWGRCRFCAEILPFRKRSPLSVVEEIEYFVSRGFQVFHFNESDVNGDPKNLYNICSGILTRGLKVKLVGQLRINKHSNAEYFKHLQKAGFVHLRFGVDGWSENTLRLQRKGYNMKMVFSNLRDCHDAGIWTTINVVIGVPGETENDIDEMISNIGKCAKSIDLVESLNILILAAGSDYHKSPDFYNIKFHGDKDELYKNHPYYIPSELWHSETPFIDHEVRVRRLDKICTGLYKQGVNIGGFTERAVKNLMAEGIDPQIYRTDLVDDEAISSPVSRVPRLVEENYKGFNIVQFNGIFYGMSQSLGPLDISKIEKSQWSEYQHNGSCVIAKSIFEVKRGVDELAAKQKKH